MERDQDHDDISPAARPADAAVPGIAIEASGTAVIAGTGIAAHRIAALLDGDMDLDEVLRDYVSLTRDQVLAAKSYADRHPWTGKPYPRLTAKKAMRDSDLSDLEPYLPARQ